MSEFYDKMLDAIEEAEQDWHSVDHGPVYALVTQQDPDVFVFHQLPIPAELGIHEFLESLADVFEDQPHMAAGWVRILPQPPLAMVVISSAVAVGVTQRAEMEQILSSGTALFDHPKKLKVHVAMGVDAYGDCYAVQRLLGREEVMQTDAPSGGVYGALRRIMCSLIAHIPDNEQYLEAMSTSLVLTLDETMAIADARQQGVQRRTRRGQQSGGAGSQ